MPAARFTANWRPEIRLRFAARRIMGNVKENSTDSQIVCYTAVFSLALSLFRFHLPPFPQKRLILRLRFGRQVSDLVKSLGDLWFLQETWESVWKNWYCSLGNRSARCLPRKWRTFWCNRERSNIARPLGRLYLARWPTYCVGGLTKMLGWVEL